MWFAFILLSLSYWKQLTKGKPYVDGCCDLLSFYYLCRTGNNPKETTCLAKVVVICFHFTIFVVLETTKRASWRELLKLWFAFILLSLSYWKQRVLKVASPWTCCDLLSFYYLCRTGNNRHKISFYQRRLWFAFILLSLSYWKQQQTMPTSPQLSCDLLSFYYLCRTGNNLKAEAMKAS